MERALLTPEGGKLRIVQRIAEFNLNLIGCADLSRVVLAPEGAGRTARDGREERTGKGERLVVKPMTGLDRLPEDLSANLPGAVDEIATDAKTIRAPLGGSATNDTVGNDTVRQLPHSPSPSGGRPVVMSWAVRGLSFQSAPRPSSASNKCW